MAQFRKKPVLVNAWRHDGPDPMTISTLEGPMTATPGDWIIVGIAGETYACRDDVFRQTYEPVDEDAVEAMRNQPPS